MIEREWREFCLRCFGDLSHGQYVDLRRTFYAGASALFFILMHHLDSGDEPTEKDIAMMDRLQAEIRQFNEAVKAGKA